MSNGNVSVTDVLRKALGENLTYLTGRPEKVRCSVRAEERFVSWLLASEAGMTVNVFSESERYDAIIVVPRSSLNRLGEAYSLAHSQQARGESQHPRETDYRTLGALEGHLGSLFVLEHDPDQDDWVSQAQFSLPSDYGLSAMPELIWRSSDYVHHEVQTPYGAFYVLVLAPLNATLNDRLAYSRRFRERAAEEVLHAYVGGQDQVYERDESAEIRIVDERGFMLGDYLLARVYEIDTEKIPTRYEALSVGPPEPPAGVVAAWNLRLDRQLHTLSFVFPDLDTRPSHLGLVKAIVKRTMKAMRRRLEPLASPDFTRAKIRTSFQPADDHFVLKASLSILGHRLNVWVYAPLEYVYQLTELIHGFVLWDLRKRSHFSALLSLITFNQHEFRAMLERNPRALVAEDFFDGGQTDDRDPGFTLSDLLGLAPRPDRIAIVQFFLIGKLGYGGSRMRSLFYYRIPVAPGTYKVLNVRGFDPDVLAPVLPRVAYDDFCASSQVSDSLDVLARNNETVLARLYDTVVRGSLDLSARTKMLLQSQFLEPHNARYREQIEELVRKEHLPRLIRSMHVVQAQNALMAMETYELARGIVMDQEARDLVCRLVSRPYWSDLEHAGQRVRADLSDGRLTLRTIYDSMHEVARDLNRAKQQKLLVDQT